MMGIGSMRSIALHFLSRRWHIIFRLGVVLGLFLLAIVIGLLTAWGRLDPNMVLFATLAPIGMLVLYHLGRFEYGILALIPVAGLVRFTLPTGTQSEIVASLLVAGGLVGVWILQLLLINKRVRLKPSPINAPLLTFVAVSTIAYVWSNLFRDPLVITWRSFPVVQLAALVVMIMLPFLTLFVSNKVGETKWLKWLSWTMVGLGVAAIISLEFALPTSEIIHTRGLFATWVAALAYALVLFNEDLSRWKRGLLLLLVMAWVHWTFIRGTLWLSGWVPLGVACALITFFRSKRLFIVAALVGIVYLGINFDSYWQRIVVANEEEGSGTGRLELWETNLSHIARHPLFGSGPAGYAVYYMTYHPEDARSTHNNLFDILAQTGIIGFATFIWLFVVFIHSGNKTRRLLTGHRDFEESFANATLAGCIAAFLAMMFGDWVVPFAYNQTITGFDNASYTWVFLGSMISLYHIVNARVKLPQEVLNE